jgi:pimeloyl-ACP methyl ester carboxylesterase
MLMDHVVVFLDHEGTVLGWNPGARELFGYDDNEIIGKHFSLFFTDEDCLNRLPERELLEASEQGWGNDNPAFRQVFTARLWPDTTAEQARSFDELQRLSASPQNAARMQRAVGEFDVTVLLPLVKVSTLVLHSRGDATVPRELGLMLAQEIPNARFVEIDSRNHFPLAHEASWDSYLEEILGFLGT